ncbi:MAG TPA: hypothetical protein VNJ08_03850 [Bacteriovoracaceae bacterium]|nr:hypothetical protein [Bacteriovoracaceae bacterium]
MRALKEILHEQTKTLKEPQFYRFQVFVNGDEKKNTVGMAWLKEGQRIYTIKLWTLLSEKFFLLPSKDDASNYLLMTREPVKSANSKKKYHWNIVGNAKALPANGVINLNFDLFDRKIFMSIYPDETKYQQEQRLPDEVLEAA